MARSLLEAPAMRSRFSFLLAPLFFASLAACTSASSGEAAATTDNGTGGGAESVSFSCDGVLPSQDAPCDGFPEAHECPYAFGDLCYSFSGRGICTAGVWEIVDVVKHDDCCPADPPETGTGCSD